MTMTDPIADMLTRIRNANLAKHQIVQIPSTKITRNIAQLLFTEGLIDSVEELKNGLKRRSKQFENDDHDGLRSRCKILVHFVIRQVFMDGNILLNLILQV